MWRDGGSLHLSSLPQEGMCLLIVQEEAEPAFSFPPFWTVGCSSVSAVAQKEFCFEWESKTDYGDGGLQNWTIESPFRLMLYLTQGFYKTVGLWIICSEVELKFRITPPPFRSVRCLPCSPRHLTDIGNALTLVQLKGSCHCGITPPSVWKQIEV